MNNDLLRQAGQDMEKALEHLQQELASLRTGRANASLVENITVQVYEQQMPLKSLANISTPDAQSITISPWDPNNLAAIEKALQADKTLDLNPQNDGSNLHINLPPMTQERREQLIKTLSEKAEATRVSMRNARHDALDTAKKEQKAGDLSQDEYHRIEKQLNEKIDNYQQRVDEAIEHKKAELMAV